MCIYQINVRILGTKLQPLGSSASCSDLEGGMLSGFYCHAYSVLVEDVSFVCWKYYYYRLFRRCCLRACIYHCLYSRNIQKWGPHGVRFCQVEADSLISIPDRDLAHGSSWRTDLPIWITQHDNLKWEKRQMSNRKRKKLRNCVKNRFRDPTKRMGKGIWSFSGAIESCHQVAKGCIQSPCSISRVSYPEGHALSAPLRVLGSHSPWLRLIFCWNALLSKLPATAPAKHKAWQAGIPSCCVGRARGFLGPCPPSGHELLPACAAGKAICGGTPRFTQEGFRSGICRALMYVSPGQNSLYTAWYAFSNGPIISPCNPHMGSLDHGSCGDVHALIQHLWKLWAAGFGPELGARNRAAQRNGESMSLRGSWPQQLLPKLGGNLWRAIWASHCSRFRTIPMYLKPHSLSSRSSTITQKPATHLRPPSRAFSQRLWELRIRQKRSCCIISPKNKRLPNKPVQLLNATWSMVGGS